MPICITGMHRSGTSMIAGLLRHGGIYFGEEIDFLPAVKGENSEGFLEHFGFYALNERLLQHLGAGWDMPDLPAGWETRADLAPFRDDASQLIERMRAASQGRTDWGWKDPRNSITIQFWKSLLPGLRVVICARNPLEVAASLQRRNNFSLAASGQLWARYYRNILAHTSAKDRVVTFYENYFDDPAGELKRVMNSLGIPVTDATLDEAQQLIKPEFHHNRASFEDLRASEFNPEAIEIYRSLRDGNSVTQSATAATTPAATQETTADADLLRSRFHVETAQREELIQRLSRENAGLKTALEESKTQFDKMADDIGALASRSDALEKELGMERNERESYSRRLSEMTERAVAVHGLFTHKRFQFAFLQGKVESTLKDTHPLLPRAIRCSNSINSLFRIFKRIRKMGKLFTLQRELNDAANESLGTLTHIATVLVSRRSKSADLVPPGLGRYTYEKNHMDVPQLMEALRMRLL